MKLEKATRVLLVLLALLLVGMGLSLAQGPGLEEEELTPLPHLPAGSSGAAPGGDGAGGVVPQAPADPAQQVNLDQWDLPINATGVAYTAAGQAWFASLGTKSGAQSDGAIGKLDPVNAQVAIYAMPGRGNIWGLVEGASGVLWYSTLNAGYVGRFDPATNSGTQWRVPGSHETATHHRGLAYDKATGNLWFTTDTYPQPDGIYRLSPGTNTATSWDTGGIEGFQGLDISPDGMLWFTFQEGGQQGIGRLDPNTDQVTLWPTGNSRPMKIVAAAANEIWLTELERNAVSVLIPTSNKLRRYAIPTASSQPFGLLRARGKSWFTEFKAGKLGRLDPAAGSPQETTLQPSNFKAARGADAAPGTNFTLKPQTQAAKLTITKVTPTEVSGFREYALPSGATAQPLVIAFNPNAGDIWFTEFGTKKIGKLRGVEPAPGPVPGAPNLNPIDNPDGDGNYQVCWSKVTEATSYRLEEDDNAGFGSSREVYAGPNLCKSVVGQTWGTWFYRVQALNSAGPSAWSNTRQVKVNPPTPQPGSAYLPMVFQNWGLPPLPPQPGRVTLLPIDNPGGQGTYTVRWTSSAKAEAYFLEEATNPSFAGAQNIYSGTETSYQVTARGAARYYYRVKYRASGGGLSDWSNVELSDVLWEKEPNDDPLTQANGPLASGLTYFGTFPLSTDVVDSYFLDHLTHGRISVYLSNIPPGSDYDLYLLNEALEVVASSERPGNLEEHVTTAPVPVGKYYVQVINRKGLVSMQPYHLKVEH